MTVCFNATCDMFIDEIFIFILQFFPTLQVSDVLDFFRGCPGSLQLLEDALDMVPLLHLSRRLAEGVGHDFADAHQPLHDLVLAFLAPCSTTFGIFHTVPLLCHGWTV